MACEPGRYADRQIQLCIGDEQGAARFENILRTKTAEFDLELIDDSDRVQRELAELGSDLVGDYPIRRFHAHDDAREFEVSATNLGLGRYQMTLSYDLRSESQRAFADEIEGELAQHFDIVVPAVGKGALPLPDCRD